MKKFLFLIYCICFVSSTSAQETRPFSFAELAEKVLPMVVNISTIGNSDDDTFIENNNVSLGSGFFIDKTGYIVTNNHVISGAEKIFVTTAKDKVYEATIRGIDKRTDLALIKIDDTEDFPFVTIGDSDNIRIGEWILAIGNPFGLGGSVTAGIVSAKSRDIESGPYDNFIQTDASINQGNSGGPMFNMAGEVIGINTAIYSTSGGNMGVGFALPINLSKFVIEQLKNKGVVERGWLGLKVQALTDDLAKSQGLTNVQGVLISSVDKNSAADKAGLEAGDILIKFGNTNLNQARDFSRMVAETKPNTVLPIEFWRNKQLIKTNISVEQMPQNENLLPSKENQTNNKNGKYLAGLDLWVDEISPKIKDKYSLPSGAEGIIVLEVGRNSDALIKGIKEGDIISQIDKLDIFSIKEAENILSVMITEKKQPIMLTIKNSDIPNFVAIKINGE